MSDQELQDQISDTSKIFEVEKIQEYEKWCTTDEIPSINFHEEWDVTIIPPFAGAIVRFRINNRVSVYLDCYDRLGYYGSPYWEVHPVDDDVARCDMKDVGTLMSLIETGLRQTDPDDGLITVT